MSQDFKHYAPKIAVSAIMLAAIVAFLIWVGSWSSCQRWCAQISSETGAGVERTVTAYSYTGEKIGEWSGHIDFAMRRDDSGVDLTFYDENGGIERRTVILNATVVVDGDIR